MSRRDNQRLISTIQKVPETRLSIIEMLETLPHPNNWNQQPLTPDQERRLQDAIHQASSYIHQTQQPRQEIERMLRRDRGW